MNVWVINQYASTPRTNTGAGERFYYLGEYWAAVKNWNVTIFSGSFNHLFLSPPERKFPANSERVNKNLHFVWVWVNRYKSQSSIGRLVNWVSFVTCLFLVQKRRLKKPHVIILSSMSLWPVLNVMVLKIRYPDVKFIFEVRDIWPLTPVYLGDFSRKHPIIMMMFWLEKMAFTICDHFVSVLPNAQLRAFEVDNNFNKGFTWIPNGITTSLLKSKSPKEDENKIFTVVYTGAIGTANAMEYVVQAAKILEFENVRFEIYGDGPEKSDLEALAGNCKNIKFYGKIPKSEVQKKLAHADVTIISWRNSPLYKYGVSANKYNDYMLSAKPIISASAFKNDLVNVADCGIQVQPENANGIVSAIQHLKRMPLEDRKKLGQNGFSYLQQNQLYPVLGEKFIKIIKTITKC